MVSGSFLGLTSLFIYGWSAQKHTIWVVPGIGAAMFAPNVINNLQCVRVHFVDS